MCTFVGILWGLYKLYIFGKLVTQGVRKLMLAFFFENAMAAILNKIQNGGHGVDIDRLYQHHIAHSRVVYLDICF